MGRKAKSPEPEPEKPAWIPSKLPTTFEHAALAAKLLVRREGKPPSDGQIAEAVSTAARLWAAVLEHGTESEVEQARLGFASRRSDAEARWHRWQNRKLGIEEDAEKAKRELGRWKERADDCFEDLEFPASADDVLERIMKQRRTDESSPGSRSVRFGRVWLEWALAADAQRWENIRSNDGRLPSEHTLLDEAMRRRRAAVDAGEAEPGWPYEGKAGAEKLRKELVKRVNAFLSAEENEIKAARLALEQQAGELRKLTLERTEAALWFRLWKEHVSQEGRDKGGEQTRIKLGGTKKKVTARPKKL
jgi:hypothetical protein